MADGYINTSGFGFGGTGQKRPAQQTQQQAYQPGYQPTGSFAYTAAGGAPVTANPNNPYPGHTDFPYPGETGAAYQARILKEWEARGMQPLNPEWDAQRAGGSGNFGLGGTPAPAGGAGGGAGAGEAELARQRELMFNAINQQKNFFNTAAGAGMLRGDLMAQLSGQKQPFSEAVRNNMFSAQADASAAQAGREQEAIRRAFGQSGIAGSGGQTAAQIDAMRRHGADTRAAKRDIDTQAQLENFAATERAQQGMQNFLGAEAANRGAATGLEAAMRSRFQVIGDAGFGPGGSGLSGLISQNGLPMGYQGRATGGVPSSNFSFQAQAPRYPTPTSGYNTPAGTLLSALGLGATQVPQDQGFQLTGQPGGYQSDAQWRDVKNTDQSKSNYYNFGKTNPTFAGWTK